MSKNYLIGIGGTGARVVEAVIHSCAAGFGPDNLSVFIVDPDEGNGNLSRTKTLIAHYKQCQALVSRGGVPGSLFHTRISSLANPVWNIFKEHGNTLDTFVNYTNEKRMHPDFAAFINVLFSNQELSTPLNEGFRGHPSIGAVVMSNVRRDEEPWKTFWDDVEASQGENSVRVFMVGSIFGGTGAAGVPTFGARRMLKFHELATIDNVRNTSKILLGGALVLPYFTIDMNVEQRSTAGQMFVTANDFPIATKAALQYYDEKADLSFDQLYFLGDSLGQKVGKFSPGAKTQTNRPHYIELMTALAAFDFFKQEPPKNQEHLFFSAAREGRVVDWDALPTTRDQNQVAPLQAQFKSMMAAMTVFAYAFATLGIETLSRQHAEIFDTWYRDNFKFRAGRVDEAEQDPRHFKTELEVVAGFGEDFLRWIAALDDEEGTVNLVERARLFSADDESLLSYSSNDGAIGSALKGSNSERKGFAQYRDALDKLPADQQHVPTPNRYINLFHRAAEQFTLANWNLQPITPA